MIRDLQSSIFRFKYNENTYMGMNVDAENTLSHQWPAIEGIPEEDDRVDWLVHVEVEPKDRLVTPGKTEYEALLIAEQLNAIDSYWSCIRFVYSPIEMSFIIMLCGIKTYLLSEIKAQCENIINDSNLNISIFPIRKRNDYANVQKYMDNIEGRYKSEMHK